MQRKSPDFENTILKALRGQKPDRPTLYELIIDRSYLVRMAGHEAPSPDELGELRLKIEAMEKGGYDYAITQVSPWHFNTPARNRQHTVSLNGQGLITDWASFEAYDWNDAGAADYSVLDKVKPYLPEGMKLCIMSPSGVLENTIDLVGYDNLCMMLYDDPELAGAVFDRVGEELYKYYENTVGHETVGFVCMNDDWGFNTQTFLSPDQMREYVFPWHKKYVELGHRYNKPCMLHSCGYYGDVMDDIVNDMKYDARHSYEDAIIPVEKAYEELHGRIAVLGGIDMNFLVSRTPEEVYARSKAMLEQVGDRGGYVLGSGNSIPGYVPFENFMAMNKAALEE